MPPGLPHDELWRLVAEASYDLMMLVDLDGRIRLANPASRFLLGREPEELIGSNGLDIAHPDDVNAILMTLAAHTEGILTGRVTARFRHRDGTYVPLEMVATNHTSDPALAGLIVTARDLGGRHRADLDAPAERYFLQTVLHEVEEGIVALDAGGSIMVINRAMLELLKLQEGSLAYTRWPLEVSLTDAVSGEVLAGDAHPLEQLRAGRQIRNLELILRRDDGSERNVVARGRSLMTPEGISLGVILALSDVTAQRAATAELERHAMHDALTGLPNRRLLVDRLAQALVRAERNNHSVAVLFCDVDQFKTVNDTLGHSAGDDLLVHIASVMRLALRSMDTVARLGGDEFVIVGEVEGAAGASALADSVIAALSEPITVRGVPIDVAMSIGVVVSAGGDDPSGLIRDADIAMYQAKELGPGRVAFFSGDGPMAARRRLASDTFIADLLDQGNLEARFQPIVSLRDGVIVGVEALARLRLPDGSLAKAGDFIELAEVSGLVSRIDPWMFRTACGAARTLFEELGERAPLVTCNVSSRALSSSAFADEVLSVLDQSGVPPSLICLELTETASVYVSQATILSMKRLRSAGMHLAVDDLGSGFSSLRVLRDLPFSVAKIDKAFTEHLASRAEDQAIVTGIVRLCHALGMNVLAEGIESAEQCAVVRQTGCDWFQGYFGGTAVELADLPGLVSASLNAER